MKKMISVVMCVYNELPNYVSGSLESLLNQSYNNIEIIIINDNPSDVLLHDLILSYEDSRIRYYRNNINLGITKSLNKGIKLCEGEFLAKMDADDICHLDRFKIQLEYLSANELVYMVGSYAEYINNKGVKIGEIKHRLNFDQIKIDTLFESVFIHPTVLYRMAVFSEHKMFYNEDFLYASDYEMWTRFIHKFKCANISEFLLKYRKSDNQISTGKVVEQTDFFMKALIKQFKFLEVNLSEREQELIRLVTRNLEKKSYHFSVIKDFSKLLKKIHENLEMNNSYNIKLLKISFLKKQFDLLRFYKGSKKQFYLEFLNLYKTLNVDIFSSIILLAYVFKFNLILKLK